jgi:hypothetical protein
LYPRCNQGCKPAFELVRRVISAMAGELKTRLSRRRQSGNLSTQAKAQVGFPVEPANFLDTSAVIAILFPKIKEIWHACNALAAFSSTITMLRRSFSLLWLVAVVVLTFLIAYPSLHIGYYFDNCISFLRPPPGAGTLYYFLHTPPTIPYSYRPIHYTILWFIHSRYGWTPVPLHLLVLPLHGLVCWLVYYYLQTSGISKKTAVLASLFMLVYEINSAAVMRLDNLNQPLGVIFGLTAIWLASKSCSAGGDGSVRLKSLNYWLAVVAMGIALLARETLLPYAAMAGLVLLTRPAPTKLNFAAVTRGMALIMPLIAVVVFYMVLRLNVVPCQPGFGSSRYDMRIGMNVVRNVFMYLGVLTIPFSTVDIFVAMRAHNWLLLAPAALVSFTWLAVVLCGLWLSDKMRFGLLLCCFIILSGFPVVLMNHLSEQWAYTGVPFVSAIIAIGVSEVSRRLQGRTILKTAFSIGVIGILVLHTASLREKMFLLLKGSDDAVKLRATIADHLDRVPPGGQVWLLNLPSNQPEYGHYLIPRAHLVCESCLAEGTKDKHRPDVHYRWVDCERGTVPNPPTNALMLVVGEEKITISPQSPIQ